jgi:hypothetical protein
MFKRTGSWVRRHPRRAARAMLIGVCPPVSGVAIFAAVRGMLASGRGGPDQADICVLAGIVTAYVGLVLVPLVAPAFLGLHGEALKASGRALGWTALAGALFMMPVVLAAAASPACAVIFVLMLSLAAAGLGVVHFLTLPFAGQLAAAAGGVLAAAIAWMAGGGAGWLVFALALAAFIAAAGFIRRVPLLRSKDVDLGARMAATLALAAVFAMPLYLKPMLGGETVRFKSAARIAADWSPYLAASSAWVTFRKTDQPAYSARADGRMYNLFVGTDTLEIQWRWDGILARIAVLAAALHLVAAAVEAIFERGGRRHREPEQRIPRPAAG